MSPEEENPRAIWQNSNMNWDESFDTYETPAPLEDQEQLQMGNQADAQMEEGEEPAKPSLFSWEGLQQIGRQFSFVIVPLLFALVICVITLPFTLPDTPTRHISFLAMIISLILLAVAQGIALYFAGPNDNLWLISVSVGFCLFVLLGSYAVFGPGFTVIMLIVLLVLAIILAQRCIRPVPEGRVDMVNSFGKYKRTLYPGFNLIRPWEHVSTELNVRETLWTCPKQVVNILHGQEVELIATLSYQLMPEDAYLAIFHVSNWEKSLHDLFVTTIHHDIHELSPEDFTGPHRKANQGSLPDPNIARLWDRMNARLWADMQDKVANWGVQVNWVQIRDMNLLPRIPDVAPAGNVRPMNMGATRGAGSPPPQTAHANYAPHQQYGAVQRGQFAQAAPVNPPSPPPASSPADSTVVISREAKNEALIDAYEGVRAGNITDPELIRDLGQRFLSIARDPEANNNFPFDAERAAHTLFQRAKLYEDRASASVYDASTEPNMPGRRRANDNLMAGG